MIFYIRNIFNLTRATTSSLYGGKLTEINNIFRVSSSGGGGGEKGEKEERGREREGKRQRRLISTPLVAVVKSIRNMTHMKCHAYFHPKPKFLDEILIFHTCTSPITFDSQVAMYMYIIIAVINECRRVHSNLP